jgi:hypothetical protein
MLTAMPIPGDRAVLALIFPTSVRSGSARSAGGAPVGNLAVDAGLLALFFERHLDGTRLSGRYSLAGFADRRPLPAVP